MPDRPDVYTHGHAEPVLRSHRWRTAENSCAYLLPHLRNDMDVLDVGCGPGTITRDLARRVAGGRVVGVDRSDAVVAAALDADPTYDGVGDVVEFRTGDVYALDFPDDAFDVVHAHQVLQHLTDPVAALVEMRRVCRPGGLVAARDADYGAFTWAPREPRMDRWLDVYRAVARVNGADPDAGRSLLAWANAAGFSEVVSSGSVWVFATPDDRAWWAGLWADRVTQTTLADQAVTAGLATTIDLEAMAAGLRDWSGQADGWFSVLHGEILARP